MRAALCFLAAMLGGIVLSGSGAKATDPSTDGPAVVIRAGDGEQNYAVNAFLPMSFEITAGTTVRWVFPWYEPHSVTFGISDSGAPPSTPSPATFDGSGFLSSDLTFGPNKNYDIRFVTPGVYAYTCVIHPAMTGQVTVLPADDIAESGEAIEVRGGAEYRTALAELKLISNDWDARPLEVNPLGAGVSEHVVTIAGETESGDVQKFFPHEISVEEGDTVRWHSVIHTPHTVTFGPFPAGPPTAGNPAVNVVSQPADNFAGSGYWNSGVLGIDWPAGVDFSMRFSRPGRYSYYCILHASQGMLGTVIVVARPAPVPSPAPASPVAPRPPATGTVGPSTDEGFLIVGLGAAITLVTASIAAWVRARSGAPRP